MDVGGDDIGARAIGGFMLGVDKKSLCVMYVLNYYRPFCQDIDHIDRFLVEILSVSRLSLEDIHFVDNPNAGLTTTIDEVIDGQKKMDDLISEYSNIEMVVIHEGFYESIKGKLPKERLMPIHLYLTYEWLRN